MFFRNCSIWLIDTPALDYVRIFLIPIQSSPALGLFSSVSLLKSTPSMHYSKKGLKESVQFQGHHHETSRYSDPEPETVLFWQSHLYLRSAQSSNFCYCVFEQDYWSVWLAVFTHVPPTLLCGCFCFIFCLYASFGLLPLLSTNIPVNFTLLFIQTSTNNVKIECHRQ